MEVPQERTSTGLVERTVSAEGWPTVNTLPMKSLCCGGATCSAVKLVVVARRGDAKKIVGVSDPSERCQKRALAAADQMPMYQGWTITLEPAAAHPLSRGNA